MNGFATVLNLVICFVILTDLTMVLLSFVWLKFSSFGWDHGGWRNKEWQEPKLGDAQVTPRQYSRKTQASKLGDAPEGIPSFFYQPSVILLGAIFLFVTWYVFYLEHLVLYESLLCLLFSLSQSSLLNTPILR
jgi:hypothetical protein